MEPCWFGLGFVLMSVCWLFGWIGFTFISITIMHVAAAASALSFIRKFVYFDFQDYDLLLFWCARLPETGRC